MWVSENPHTSGTRTQTVRFIIRGDGGAREGNKREKGKPKGACDSKVAWTLDLVDHGALVQR